MAPVSQDLSTIASVQEIAATAVTVENNPSTSKLYVVESDITTTTASLDSVTDMKTIAPTGSNIIPSITGMTDFMETPTTSMAMDNNMQSMEHVSTTVAALVTEAATVTIPVASTMTMTTSNGETNEVFKQPDETDSVVVATTPSIALPTTLSAITTSMTITNDEVNESFKQPEETVSVTVTTTTSQPLSVQAETTISSTLFIIPSELNEQSLNEVDNVLTMSSNEDTTRMASSTDNKIENDVKQNEPPKSQETKNELEPGKNGCNSIFISLAVLSTAVLYVIV